MKYILGIRNYDYNNLYIDTDTMEFALDDYHYDEDFRNSEVYEFQNKFLDSNSPIFLLQRKTDFYEFVEFLKENGYKEIEYNPIEKKDISSDIEREE